MKRALYTFFLLLLLQPLFSQTSAGTRFWCGFMENINILFNDDPVFRFEIEATTATNGTISIPTTGLIIPFTAAANAITQVTLPNTVFYTIGSEIIDNKGILITSDEPVRVSAFHYRAYFSESSHLLPEDELGTEYIVTCYRDDANNSPTAFVIVSTTDNNEIEITPTTLTEGLRPADIPFTITLNAGQNYQVKANGDLTGTQIRSLSNDNIAVFSGAQQANVELCNGADSHLYDQSIPIEQWTELYYYVPFQGQGGDPIRITASTDNTAVFFDCNQVASLNRGEFYTEKRFAPTVITATHPIAVSQFNSSQGCNPSDIGDPNMLRLHPPIQAIESVRFYSPEETSGLGFSYFASHFVNVIMPSDETGNIQLDGSGFETAFAPFPADPAYAFAQLEVDAGTHQLSSSTPFVAYSYGFGDFDAYTTHLGFGTPADPVFACLSIEVDGTLCVDSLLTFFPVSNLPIASWSWNFGDGSTATAENPTHIYQNPGDYEVVLSVILENGGEVSTSITITIADCGSDPCAIPQTLEIIPGENTCLGDLQTFTLDASFEIAGQSWILEGQVVGSASTYSAIFDEPGTYLLSVIAIDNFNCQWTATFAVTPENCGNCQGAGEQELQFEGSLCVDSTLQFFLPFDADFSPPLDVNWVFDGEFTDELNPAVTLNSAGLFVVEFFATDIFGCFYTGALELLIDDCEVNDPCDPLPIATITPNGALCTNQAIAFTASSNAPIIDFSWTATNGATATSPTFTTIFDEPGVVAVQFNGMDANGCPVTASIAFDIEACDDPCDQQPAFMIGAGGDFCPDSTIQFSANTNATLTDFDWQFSTGASSSAAFPLISFPATGAYSVSLVAIDVDGCVYTDTVDFDILDCNLPCEDFVRIQPPADICAGEPLGFSFITNTTLQRQTWTTATGQQSGLTNPNFTLPMGASTISLEVQAEDGCVYTDEVTIEVSTPCIPPELCPLGMPNAFSPNEDGNNDELLPVYKCPPFSFEFKIFDRWGGLLFETRNLEEGWDGTVAGQAADTGIYVWLINYTLQDGTAVQDYGDVLLMR
jgi:gliding motility-associated-like protein